MTAMTSAMNNLSVLPPVILSTEPGGEGLLTLVGPSWGNFTAESATALIRSRGWLDEIAAFRREGDSIVLADGTPLGDPDPDRRERVAFEASRSWFALSNATQFLLPFGEHDPRRVVVVRTTKGEVQLREWTQAVDVTLDYAEEWEQLRKALRRPSP